MLRFSFFLLIINMITLPLVHGEELIHIIKKGETLYSLSRKYSVSLDDILKINNIDDPQTIREGYSLIIKEDKNTYTVKKGDTLYSIARSNNVGIKELIDENNITKKTIIKVGQKIYLPDTIKNQNDKIAVKEEKIPSAVKNTVNKDDFFWPVDGQIEKLNGKLQGSKISAKKGEPVYSVSSGRVVWEGPYRGFGRVIFIESDGGYVYVYGGNEKTIVSVGDMVEPGSEIGYIGLNIHENKPNMYFSIYKNGEPVDVEKAPRL